MTATTDEPGPSRSATRSAAATSAPVEVPAKIPVSRASLRPMIMASALVTCSIASIWSGSHSGGMNPIPIPSTRWDPLGSAGTAGEDGGLGRFNGDGLKVRVRTPSCRPCRHEGEQFDQGRGSNPRVAVGLGWLAGAAGEQAAALQQALLHRREDEQFDQDPNSQDE